MTINASAVWRVRPGGSNTNGGGFDAAITGAGTDYSQQNGAQASGTHGSNAGTAFSDTTANAFTAAMVGNALYITGGGATAGYYFCTGYTSAGTITLDRSPGTVAGATWHLGGAWADFWTNTTSSGPLVSGNTVYILGSGMPSPSGYTYDYTATTFYSSWANGSSSSGQIRFIGDPNTPSGGFPCVKVQGLFVQGIQFAVFQNIWFVAANSTFGNYGVIASPGTTASVLIQGCTFDQFGYDVSLTTPTNGLGSVSVIGCEVTSSVSKRSTNANPGIYASYYGATIFGNNVHDCIGAGICSNEMSNVSFNIVSKNGAVGIYVNDMDGSADRGQSVSNNTIDGNVGNGIEFASQVVLSDARVFNNLISNHTQSGTYGMTVDAGTQAQNDRVKGFVDYNTFYNNTTDVNAISYGAHDTHGGSNPYTAESSDNFSLTSGYYGTGTAPASFPQNVTGWNG